ncbi:MAG: UDP-glucose 4-epimerase GalE [Proteobacteria bacterium]|nr:UDP-glucose 4-epimerase GalE [Pseudomonadota bacterium]
MKTILVTGGAGYIGSHTCVRLLESGYDVVIMDSLVNSHEQVLQQLAASTSRKPVFVRTDVRNRDSLEAVFANIPIDAVIHFCGLKAVGESVGNPLDYYDVNIGSTVALCRAMRDYGVRDLVFSSSATVYGAAGYMPIAETAPVGATNPYGRTKLMIEQILADLYASDPSWNLVMLRYFNPVGAHPSGLIGEDPLDTPNNLFPYITQVAAGRLPELSVYGGDYPTPDGTGVRDYIHVMDLAEGHLRALEHLQAKPGFDVFNLGTGRGCSVLEAVRTFEAVNGVPVPHRITARRPGDVAVCYADAGKARQVLGWEARLGIEDMVRDAWNWQCGNPNGYRGVMVPMDWRKVEMEVEQRR